MRKKRGMMKRVLKITVFTVALFLAAISAYGQPSVQSFIEPGYAVGYYTSYYTYRINSDGTDFINEAVITVPSGVSGVFGISSGMVSASPALNGDKITITYGVPWNAFSNPNFDVIGFYALSDAGDKYYGCYFNATPDAVGVTANGFSQYVIIRTSTPTFTASPTISMTQTLADTPAGTYTITETHSVTPSITLTLSKSETPNWTATHTKTVTQTHTGTPPTATTTPSVTKTSTRTVTPSRTMTVTPTSTRTATPTRTSTVTPTVTITNTITIKGIEVSAEDHSGPGAASGQPSAGLVKIGFTNIGGSQENVTAVNITLKNSYGAPLVMSDVLANLYLVDKNGNTVASSAAPAAVSQNMVFAPVLSVPLQAAEYLYLYADMKATTFAASFSAGVESSVDVACVVPVTARPPFVFPVYPQPMNLKKRTTVLQASYYDLMPPSVSTGQKNVYAFMLSLENPGGADFSAALLNYLTITVKDAASNPIPADSAVSRFEIRDASRVYFSSTAIPASNSVLCSLAEPVTIEAAAVKNIYVIADVASSAGSAGTFRLSVEAPSDLKMSEYYYGMPVTCYAKSGFSFPQESSAALIQDKASEIGVEYSDSAPLYVSTGQNDVEAMKIVLTNKGNTSTSSAMVTRMTFYLNDQFNAGLAAQQVLNSIKVTSHDSSVTFGQLVSFSGAKMTVNFTSPVVVSSASPVTVLVKLGVSAAYYSGIFKLSLNAGDDIYAVDANIFEVIPVTSLSSFPKRTAGTQMQQRALNTGLVNFMPLLPTAIIKGQSGIPLLSFGITNSNAALSAAEEFYRLTINIKNQFGSDIAAGTALGNVYLVDSYGATRASAAAGFLGSVVFNVSPPVTVSQAATVSFTLYADVPVVASAPVFAASIVSAAGIAIRDINSKDECVKSTPQIMPWTTTAATIYSSPATDVLVAGDGNMAPAMVGRGQPDVRIMMFDFYNPGGLGTADVSIKGITVTALDGFGSVIAPVSAMSAARIINASTSVVCGYVDLSLMTTAAPFYIPVNLTALYAPYSNTVSAYITADISLNPAVNNFNLRVVNEQAVDASSSPSGIITKNPGPAAVFPVDSKVTTISSFALGYDVGHSALMPVSAAQGQTGVTAMRVLFDNTNSAPISVTSVAVAVKDNNGVLISADGKAAVFYVLNEAGNTVATQAAPASGNVVLHPAGYSIAANSTGYLTIAFDLTTTAQGLFYLELEAASSIGTLPVAFANPMPGENFGNMESGTLSVQLPFFEESVHAFPNPFDPGTGAAHIEYYLPSDSRVTIRIFTISGKPVAQVVEGVLKQAGLHNEDEWLAINTEKKEVKSGVYIVLIEAEPVGPEAKLTARKRLVVLR